MFQCVRTEFEDDGLAGAFCVDQPRCKEGIKIIWYRILALFSQSLCAPGLHQMWPLVLGAFENVRRQPAGRLILKVGAGCFIGGPNCVWSTGSVFCFSFSFFSLGRNILIYLCADKNVSSDSLFTSYLVDPASSICLSQRLSHACLSTSR